MGWERGGLSDVGIEVGCALPQVCHGGARGPLGRTVEPSPVPQLWHLGRRASGIATATAEGMQGPCRCFCGCGGRPGAPSISSVLRRRLPGDVADKPRAANSKQWRLASRTRGGVLVHRSRLVELVLHHLGNGTRAILPRPGACGECGRSPKLEAPMDGGRIVVALRRTCVWRVGGDMNGTAPLPTSSANQTANHVASCSATRVQLVLVAITPHTF